MVPSFIYNHTPYEIRRKLYGLFFPEKVKRYEQLRQTDLKGYSCKPFLNKKCIFIHIPKTAGVSVAKALFGNLGGGHRTVRDYQLIFSKEEFNSFFKFTFVRNPWERTFSAYNFLAGGGMTDRNREWAEKNLSEYTDFNDFICRGLKKREVLKYDHFKQQSAFIDKSANGRELIDFIGFFENIEADFRFISERINGKHIPLSHQNKGSTRNGSYLDHYSDESKQIVAEIYRNDIQRFGYDFENKKIKNQQARRDREF